MKKSHPLFGIALVLGYALCSVIAYLTIKYVFLIEPNIAPINAIFWGFFGAMLIAGTFILSHRKERTLVRKEWHEHKKLIITISLMTSLGAFLWAWSLQMASAGTVGLIGRVDVLMTLALGALFFKERFSWKSILGAIIALIGLGLVANLPNEISLFVVGIVVFMRLMYAMQSFLVKKSGQKLRGIPFTFWRVLIITIALGIAAFASGNFYIPKPTVIAILFCSQLFGAYVGRVCYFEAHKYLGIGHINLLSLTQPVLLLVGSWWLLNESMPAQKIIGGAILLFGLTLIVLEKWKPKANRFSLTRIFATLRPKKDVIENPADLN
jgi:drug/metabolite transporter (DMT)-like permease